MEQISLCLALLLVISPPEACGGVSSNPRIVGGAAASPGSWPWMVHMVFNGSDGQAYLCGGSLISQQWILTAAHCTSGMVINQTLVHLGLSRLPQESNLVKRGLVHSVVHPLYNSTGQLENDLCLVKMPAPVAQSFYVQPVRLAQSHSTFHTGVTAWATGWGLQEEGGDTFPKVLQEVSLPIVGDNQCKCLHSFHLPDKTICAGFAEGGKDSCQGDSGGPLVVKYGTVWVQAGIVSFGDGCGAPNKPGVYTEVSEYQDWIESTVGPEDPPGFVEFVSTGMDSDSTYECTDPTTPTSHTLASTVTATTFQSTTSLRRTTTDITSTTTTTSPMYSLLATSKTPATSTAALTPGGTSTTPSKATVTESPSMTTTTTHASTSVITERPTAAPMQPGAAQPSTSATMEQTTPAASKGPTTPTITKRPTPAAPSPSMPAIIKQPTIAATVHTGPPTGTERPTAPPSPMIFPQTPASDGCTKLSRHFNPLLSICGFSVIVFWNSVL